MFSLACHVHYVLTFCTMYSADRKSPQTWKVYAKVCKSSSLSLLRRETYEKLSKSIKRLN